MKDWQFPIISLLLLDKSEAQMCSFSHIILSFDFEEKLYFAYCNIGLI